MSRAPARCAYCGHKALIRNSEEVTIMVRDVYFDCTNSHCGHRWKAKLEFEHSIAIPAGQPREGIPIMPRLRKALGFDGPPKPAPT